MQFIGSQHALSSETDENNVFVIKCHANNQVISTIVTTNIYFYAHEKNCKVCRLQDTFGRMCKYVYDGCVRCNRLRCPLARMSGLQCINMGHNGHGINLYGVSMTLMGN